MRYVFELPYALGHLYDTRSNSGGEFLGWKWPETGCCFVWLIVLRMSGMINQAAYNDPVVE